MLATEMGGPSEASQIHTCRGTLGVFASLLGKSLPKTRAILVARGAEVDEDGVWTVRRPARS